MSENKSIRDMLKEHETQRRAELYPNSITPAQPNRPRPEEGTTGTMTFVRVAGLSVLVLISFLIGNGTNSTAAMFAPVFFISAIALYFLPSIEAGLRKHPSLTSVGLLNLFLGWTLIGWVAAIAWACAGSDKTKDAKSVDTTAPIIPAPSVARSAIATSIADEITKLAALKEKGLLTDAEFAQQKDKLLA